MPRKKRTQPPPYAADRKGRQYKPRYAVAVECADERAQRRLYNRLRKMGLEARVLVL